MVTIAKNGAGESFITMRVRGNSADYLSQLQALAAALSDNPLTTEQRRTLSNLLIEILPTENQLTAFTE